MKKLILFVFIGALFSACTQVPIGNSNNNPSNPQRIHAKVIRITCATTVIQILDSSYYNLGETWIDNGASTTYNHVAVVANKCEFPSTLTVGSEFYFKQISKAEADQNCAVCMLYDFPPSKSILLKVVQ